MKVISIKQPWASLIVAGYKKFEFRTWKTNYRGEILIHASKISDKENLIRFTDLNLTYPTGQIIGKAYLADSLISENSLVYGANHNRVGYAFKLSNVKKLDKPISINGNLGLWDFDGKIE